MVGRTISHYRIAALARVARLVLVSGAVVFAGSGLRPAQGQTQGQTAQDLINASVRRMADETAASARRWLGNLHPAGQLAFRRWILAVGDWKKEKADRPAALLAEGVLFDCLGRTLGLNTGFSSGIVVDPRFNELGQPYRLQRAAQLFEEAFEADPNLLEARFRAARIRALDNARSRLDLERIARSHTDALLSYLAAVSRAAIAQQRHDGPTAIRWYDYALELDRRSTAAAVGLSTLQPDRAIPFDSLDPDDPYYSYPCRVLTPSVATELASRLGRVEFR